MDGLAVVLVIFNIIALLGVTIFVFMNSSSISEIQDELDLIEKNDKNEDTNNATLKTDVATLKANRDTLKTDMENVKATIGPTYVSKNPTTTVFAKITEVEGKIDTHAGLKSTAAHA